MKNDLSDQQLVFIRQQLGREPRGIVGIAASSKGGVPLVLKMRSLVDDKPFPTLYWLSSKDLHKAIAHIETSGAVKQLEQRIQEDEGFRHSYLNNHKNYVRQRWQAMTAADKSRLETLGFSDLFHRYGIGGIAQWDKVRCLHMQYAHHLAADNVIGQWMDETFDLQALTING